MRQTCRYRSGSRSLATCVTSRGATGGVCCLSIFATLGANIALRADFLLENQLHANLQLPHVDVVLQCCDLAEAGAGDGCVREIEVRMVQGIERFKAHLQECPFGKVEVLLYGRVEDIDTGSGDDVAAGVAVRAERL